MSYKQLTQENIYAIEIYKKNEYIRDKLENIKNIENMRVYDKIETLNSLKDFFSMFKYKFEKEIKQIVFLQKICFV